MSNVKEHDRNKHRILDRAAEDLFHEKITRREFVRRTSALGISAILMSDVLVANSRAMAASQPTEEVPNRIAKEGGKLFIYNWEDYIHPDTIPEFEKEFGVEVTYDTFPGNEHLLAKIQAGNVPYDVIFPTQNFLAVYINLGLLSPLDHQNLPNIANLMPNFRDVPFDFGNKYSVAYDWGMTGIGYNSKYTRGDPNIDSWSLLFDSGPQRYSGRLGFTDEREEVIGAALKYLGYSVNTHNRNELLEAGELLIKTKPHVKAFYPGVDEKKAFITEDVIIGHSWNGEVVKAQEKNPDVKWSLPKEGCTGWYDAMAIPKVSTHKFTAEVFINYMLRPDVGADNSNATGYATANRVAAEKYVEPQVYSNPAIYPTDDDLARIEFLAAIPDDVLVTYDEIWSRLLAS